MRAASEIVSVALWSVRAARRRTSSQSVPVVCIPSGVHAGLLLLSFLASSIGRAQSVAQQPEPTAALVTQSGRTIGNALDMFFGSDAAENRTLLLLVEPSIAVAEAGLPSEVEAALARNQDVLGNARVGVGFLSADKGALEFALRPQGPRVPKVGAPPDHQAVNRALASRLNLPALQAKAQKSQGMTKTYDFHLALRSVAKALGAGKERRRVLTIVLDSCEVESEIEQTAQDLQKSNLVADFLSREATLSDAYWRMGNTSELVYTNWRRQVERPNSGTLVGGDSPFQDMPAGFLFQRNEPTCLAPSAFAPYAITRVAYATGGRSFLYSKQDVQPHRCNALSVSCEDCSLMFAENAGLRPRDAKARAAMLDRLHDHKEAYAAAQLYAMAPSVMAREDVRKRLERDPFAFATRLAWRKAYSAGLVATAPWGGGDPQEARRLLMDAQPTVHASVLQRMLTDSDAIRTELQAALERLGDAGDKRQRAIAHYTVAMLHVTRVNLLRLRAFAATTGAARPGTRVAEVTGDAEPKPSMRIEIDSEQSLCHGLVGHLGREKDDAARKAMLDLQAWLPALEKIAERSPFWWSFHRASIATFKLSPHQGSDPGAPHAPRPTSKPEAGPTTPRPSSPTPSGPTTGGGD